MAHSVYTQKSKTIVHCVSKNVPPVTCYNLDIHEPIVLIFGRSITEKIGNPTILCFPTSLSSGCALRCKTENPEIASFHLNTVRCFANKHKTHSN